MRRPWVAIGWLAVWGVFQAFAVVSVLNGTWTRPAAFPGGAYEAMVYADLVFIPLYLGRRASGSRARTARRCQL